MSTEVAAPAAQARAFEALLALALAVAVVVSLRAVFEPYPNAGLLAEPSWLSAHLHDDQVRVIDVRGPLAFRRGHVPGAVQLGDSDLTTVDFATGKLVLKSPDELAQALRGVGLDTGDTVVVYGDEHSDGRPERLFWLLETLGVQSVKVLRGGLAAWQAAAGEIETGAAATVKPGDFAAQPDNHPIATADEIRSVLDARDGHIIDARTLDAFLGNTTDPRPGHIPGAASLPAATLYRGPDDPIRPHELRLALSRVHVHTVHPIVIYGDSLAEAASVYFALRLLGVVRVDVFSGGYASWSADAANPVEKPAAGAAPVTVSTTCFQ